MPSNDTQILFRLRYTVSDQILSRLVKEKLEWTPTTSAISLTLDRSTEPNRKPDNLDLTVLLSRGLDSQLVSMFRDLMEGKLPKGSNVKRVGNDVAADGRLKLHHVPPLDSMPLSFQQFCSGANHEMSTFARQSMTLLRWRAGLASGSPHLLALREFTFSLDQGSWNPVPHSLSVHVSTDLPHGAITKDAVTSMCQLLKAGHSEPLSRSLLREAWHLKNTNPSSALVIGYVAAEVGTKELIRTLVPGAGWLAFEVPSPPLDRILTKYIPTLPARLSIKGKILVPKGIRKLLQKAMIERNGLAHKGEMSISIVELEGILRGINDLLWLFDVYCGHGWAWEHIDSGTRNGLHAETE